MDPMNPSDADAMNDIGTASGEWVSPYRMTPEVQAALVRELAIDLRETAPASGGATRNVQRVAEGKIPPDAMVIALQLKGHLGAHVGGGKFNVLCMNDGAHTKPPPSITADNARGDCVILPPLEGQSHGHPFCSHGHCASLRREDWIAFLGADTWKRAQEIVAEMQSPRDAVAHDTPDPLDGLAERIVAEGTPERAFDDLVVGAALTLQAEDAPAFQQLRRALKGAGVAVSQWDQALRDRQRAQKRATKEADRQRAIEAAGARRQAAEEAREAERARLIEAQEQAPTDLAVYYAESEFNGVSYRMDPSVGTSMETFNKRGEPEVTVLAPFVPIIAADVLEFSAPDATPRRTLTLSVLFAGARSPVTLDHAPGELDKNWPETLLGSRGVVAPIKGAREHLRVAMQRCSRPREQRRYRFTGWVSERGQWVYLSADKSFGADGVIEDVDVRPPEPADRFRLPAPPEGEALRRALDAVVAFFDVNPAEVVVPLVGLVFRAPLGRSRVTLHISGTKGTGKSLLAGLAQKFVGTGTCSADCSDGFVAQWTDGSSAKGIGRTLATIGDAVVVVDDLRVGGARDEHTFAMFDHVIRAHFNRSAPRKLTREGGARNDPPSRCSILSTGEVLPQGHSTRDRVVGAHLATRPTPDLGPLVERANAGEFAAAMAAYVAHCAPRYDEIQRTIGVREKEAAQRWGLGDTDRAAGLLGALALGLESMFAFLAEHHALPEDALKARKRRALDAMRKVAGAHSATVEAENPAKLLCLFVGDAVRSGEEHFARILPSGEAGPPSASPGAWGWRLVQRGAGSEWEPRGRRLGRLSTRDDEVLLDPGPALDVARERARRAGRALAIDAENMGRSLKAAGVLGTPDEGSGTLHVLRRIGAGLKAKFFPVKITALGVEIEDASNDRAQVAADAPTGADFDPTEEGR